jgi:perosamine synthetase
VPAQTFIATGASVLRAGATIVFCDTDRNFLLDFESLKSKITSNTKAVIIVHFAGLISKDVFKIKKYLEERNIVLIEDAAHAHGAVMDQIKAGNIGDFGCFSFYSTKIMTAGEGGIITTNNNSYYKKCASIRNRGIDSDFDKKECFINLGSNYRMTEIQAILCRTQLDRLPEFLLHRKRIAAVYKNELKDLIDSKKLRLQNYDGNNGHSYWRFIVFLNDGLDRDHIKSKMQAKNIIVDAPYDPLLHQQPLFKNKEVFQNADYYCNHHISLPIHMLVSVNDAVFIAKSLRESICE